MCLAVNDYKKCELNSKETYTKQTISKDFGTNAPSFYVQTFVFDKIKEIKGISGLTVTENIGYFSITEISISSNIATVKITSRYATSDSILSLTAFGS